MDALYEASCIKNRDQVAQVDLEASPYVKKSGSRPEIAAMAAVSLANRPALVEASASSVLVSSKLCVSSSSSLSSSCPSSLSSSSSLECMETAFCQEELVKRVYCKKIIDLTAFCDYYKCKNLEAILKDKKLFWTLFCRLHCHPKHSIFGKFKFTTIEEDTCLCMAGMQAHIDYFKCQIEQIRHIILRNWDVKSAFTLVILEYGRQIYLREKSDVPLTLHHHHEQKLLNQVDLFYDHVRPTLENIFNIFNLSYVMKVISQKFFPHLSSMEAQKQCFDAFEINFT